MLGHYADDLAKVNGRLYLTGVSEAAYQQIVRADELHGGRAVRAHHSTPIVWESTGAAVADAEAWLASGAEASE